MPYVQCSVVVGIYSLSISERKVPRDLAGLAEHIKMPELIELTRRFLHDQIHPDGPSANDIMLEECPEIHTKISVFSSATATFYAPSDESGIRGMRREHIWSTHSWRNQGLWRDCVLVVEDETKPGIKGLTPVRIRMFFSFFFPGKVFTCAFFSGFKKSGTHPSTKPTLRTANPHNI